MREHIYEFIHACILYLTQKVLKQSLTYKTCVKLTLPGTVIGTLYSFFMWIIMNICNIEAGIIGVLIQVLYFVSILPYYLNKLYKFKYIHTILISVVYLFISLLISLQ